MTVEELMSRLAVLEHSLGPGLNTSICLDGEDKTIARVYEEQLSDGSFVVVIEGKS